MEVKTFDQIYNDMKNHIIASQDRLTDFNDGGILVSQIEAHAREMSLLYVSCRIGFSTFLRSLPHSVFGFQMKEGVRASAEVIFSRSRSFSYDSPIPAGTIVSAGGLNFVTVEASAVGSGQIDSPPVIVTAQEVGDNYNVSAGAIKTVVSVLSADIVTVNNPAGAVGGENSEDWAAYTDRFADFILGLQRTNSSGLLSGLNSGRLIRSMSIDEHFPPLDGLWNMTLYLEDGSGGMAPEAFADAKRIIDGNIAKGIGGYRAPGINIRYLPPDIVPVTLRITVAMRGTIVNEVDTPVVENEVKEAIRNYINGLKIGEHLLLSALIVVLKRLNSLSNVRPTFPLEDIIINPNQIVRYKDCDVQVETEA
jgi:hypothetical protein